MRHSFVLEQNPASNAVARQVFFTQYAAKFAEKTLVYACEDRVLKIGNGEIENFSVFVEEIFKTVLECGKQDTEKTRKIQGNENRHSL